MFTSQIRVDDRSGQHRFYNIENASEELLGEVQRAGWI